MMDAMEKYGFFVISDIGDENVSNYAALMKEFENFSSLTHAEKEKFTSTKVYRNEKNLPMWFMGYEGGSMREAFRSSRVDLGCWPSDEFKDCWFKVNSFLQQITDRCLSIAMEREISVPQDPSDDKSVSYAVFYPNNRGGQQEEGINIKVNYIVICL